MTKNQTTYRSGTGAAHVGFAMFGARGPLLAPEGDGGGSSGAAATEGAAGQAATNAGDGGVAAARTFTQAEVDQIVKDRVAKVKTAVAPQQQAAAKLGDDPSEKPLTMRELQNQLNEERARREFDRRASKFGLSDEAADDMFSLSQVQKPADVGAWLESKAKLFGSGVTKGSAAAGTNTEAQQGAKPPAVAPGAPGEVTTFVDHGGAVDLYSRDSKIEGLSGQQIRAIHERNVSLASASSGAPPMPRFGNKK